VERQRGSALIETVVAIAIVSVAGGAILSAIVFATHTSKVSPTRSALESALRREMPLAVDVLKYQGGAIEPATVATTVPMPTGSPLTVRMSIAVSPAPEGSLRIAITASATNGAPDRVELSATLASRAPAPGAMLAAPGLAPAPTGAP
jgi:type II secretory pathway pseudopilin PulG